MAPDTPGKGPGRTVSSAGTPTRTGRLDHLAVGITTRPWLWLGLWVLLAGSLIGLGRLDKPKARESALLPPDYPSNVASARLAEAFGHLAGRSRIVILAESPTEHDPRLDRYLEALTTRLQAAAKQRWRVLSASSARQMAHRLCRPRAGLVVLHLDENFITEPAAQAVEAVEQILAEMPAKGLSVCITGDAVAGRDAAALARRGLQRMEWVSVPLVAVVLAIICRSLWAPWIPLVAIGLSIFVALQLQDWLGVVGISASSMERMFTIVLMFGSGADFALLLLARRQELRGESLTPKGAIARAWRQTAPAIMLSIATTVLGLSCLGLADFFPARNSGRILPGMLMLALASALTLIPALMGLVVGRQKATPAGGYRRASRRRWRWLAAQVVRHPGRCLLIMLLALGIPAVIGTQLKFHYQAIADLPSDAPSMFGRRAVARHFAEPSLSPVHLLVQTAKTLSPEQIRSLLGGLEDRLSCIAGVANVFTELTPMGDDEPAADMTQVLARPFYRSADQRTLRAEVWLSAWPYSEQAFDTCQTVMEAASSLVAQRLGAEGKVLATGVTPYMLDIKRVSVRDRRVVQPIALLVIGLVVLLALGDLTLSVVMLLGTVVTYLATLALSARLAEHVFGLGGLDWKVQLFLFVIVVAVGQDYNIFLVSRFLAERKKHPLRGALRRAVVSTGPVISNCGLIMAATLGSLSVTGLRLMQQLGLALALGILLDAFLVRPIVLPACLMLRERLRSRVR